MALSLAGCAATPVAPPPTTQSVATAVRPPASWYCNSLFSLAESYQPRPSDLPNRWSEIVRTAFLYSGALTIFAADSAPAQALAADPGARLRPEDFMLVASSGSSDPALLTEAGRFLDQLESRGFLLHLHQIAEPCRLLAPPPYPDALLTMQETYEQAPLRNLAAACNARMHLACRPSPGAPLDPEAREQFLRAFRSGMNLGRALCGRPMLVSLTNAHAVQNSSMLTALELARRGLLDDHTFDELLAAADASRLPHPATFLEMERIIGLESIDTFFDEQDREQASAPADATVSFTELTRKEAIFMYYRSIEAAIEILQQELGEAPTSPSTPRVSGVTYDTLEIPEGRTDPRGILASLAPPLSSLIQSELEHRCVRAAFITGLRLEAHRRTTGGYPHALSELTPPPPEDPLLPGRLLGYQPPDPRAGNDYLLYSVGADRTDNGGKPPASRPRRDALFVPVRWRDSDYPITGPSGR